MRQEMCTTVNLLPLDSSYYHGNKVLSKTIRCLHGKKYDIFKMHQRSKWRFAQQFGGRPWNIERAFDKFFKLGNFCIIWHTGGAFRGRKYHHCNRSITRC